MHWLKLVTANFRIQLKNLIPRTEPAAVGLNASAGELLGLKLMAQNLALAVTLRPRVVHLEAAHGGGAAGLGFPILPVHVQGVLGLPGDVHLLLFLLRHLQLASPEENRQLETIEDARNVLQFVSRVSEGEDEQANRQITIP